MIAKLPCDDLGASAAPAGPGPERSAARWALIAAILGSVLASLDATAVNVSLPTLQREFTASPAAVQWIVEGFALFLSALILVGGALGDRFGRRRIFTIGTLGFGLASLACGLAPGIDFLIAARCIQGMFAALLIPGSLSLISAAYDEKGRGAAIGTWAGLAALSSAVGPPLGGWLTQSASWRWIFFINVPVAALVVAIAALRVHESHDDNAPKRFDIPGAIYATLGLGGLTFGFVELQQPHADVVLNTLALVIGLAALGMFARVEATASNPMIPRELFANRAFVSANVYTFVLYAAMGGAIFFVPFYLQFVRGYSPLASGAALLPFVGVMTIGSRFAGGFFTQRRVRLALTIGPLAEALGLTLFALAPLDSAYWLMYFPAAAAMGAGAAVFVAPLTTLAMNAARAHAGAGSGVNNAVSRAGGLLAVAVLGTLVFAAFSAGVHRTIEDARYSPATRSAVTSHFDRIAAFEIPKGVPAAEHDALLSAVRADYAGAFKLAMLAAAAACVAASLYAGFAIRSGDAIATGARLAAAR